MSRYITPETMVEEMMSELSAIVTTIKKPLLYASKDNFTNLDKVKEVESCVHTQVHKALNLPNKSAG